MYDYASCDLLTVGATSEIYRLNLEKGTFLKPLQSSCPSINVSTIPAKFAQNNFGIIFIGVPH